MALPMSLIGLRQTSASAQDRLKGMPGYERYQKMSREIPNSVKMGTIAVTWKDDGKGLEYRSDGKNYRYDFETRQATLLDEAAP